MNSKSKAVDSFCFLGVWCVSGRHLVPKRFNFHKSFKWHLNPFLPLFSETILRSSWNMFMFAFFLKSFRGQRWPQYAGKTTVQILYEEINPHWIFSENSPIWSWVYSQTVVWTLTLTLEHCRCSQLPGQNVWSSSSGSLIKFWNLTKIIDDNTLYVEGLVKLALILYTGPFDTWRRLTSSLEQSEI